MRPLLGDFLSAASRHLDAASRDLGLAAEVTPSVVGELVRLTTVMARCADAFAGDDRSDSRHLKDATELVVHDTRSALRQAATRMHAAGELLGNGGDAARPTIALHMSAAADNLAAGHDLLQTHFGTDQSGWRHGTSFWAPAIASQQVNAALVSEMGSHAGRLANWALQLAAACSGESLPSRARAAISEGCRWLWVAEAASRVARHNPGVVAGRALLHAVPINLPPPPTRRVTACRAPNSAQAPSSPLNGCVTSRTSRPFAATTPRPRSPLPGSAPPRPPPLPATATS